MVCIAGALGLVAPPRGAQATDRAAQLRSTRVRRASRPVNRAGMMRSA